MLKNKTLIFSFDDGPAPLGALDTILSTLEHHCIVAEFYVLGKKVEQNPEAACLIVTRGHKIQNHSWDHPDLTTLSEADVLQQLERTQEAIVKATGISATKLRPPYGAGGGWPKSYAPELAKVAARLSLKIHNWDIDSEDWNNPKGLGPDKINTIIEQIKNNASKSPLSLLMHVQDETARDLDGFIRALKVLGCGFVPPTAK